MDLDALRIFLHLFGVAGWVGGQVLMVGLMPVLRSLGPDAPRAAARRFARVAWPCFGLAVATGLWSLAEVGLADRDSGYPRHDPVAGPSWDHGRTGVPGGDRCPADRRHAGHLRHPINHLGKRWPPERPAAGGMAVRMPPGEPIPELLWMNLWISGPPVGEMSGDSGEKPASH